MTEVIAFLLYWVVISLVIIDNDDVGWYLFAKVGQALLITVMIAAGAWVFADGLVQ